VRSENVITQSAATSLEAITERCGFWPRWTEDPSELVRYTLQIGLHAGSGSQSPFRGGAPDGAVPVSGDGLAHLFDVNRFWAE